MNPAYLEDASGFRGHADRLLAPRDELELAQALHEAYETSTPLTVAGAGTGVTGGRVAKGGWVLSLEHFRRLEINDGQARVGCGVLLRDLHAAALRSGQFYAPDPTEIAASLGGTIATNASGSRSFRYGDTRRHILALHAGFCGGSVREFERGDSVDFDLPLIRRPNTAKMTAGYPLRPGMDWVDLITGSEGTLAVVTEATVRLLPAPGSLLAGVIFFPSMDAALAAVPAWRSIQGLRMIEYFDAGSLELLRARYPETPGPARAALLIEQELESDDELDAWENRLGAVEALTEESWFADDDQGRERFRRYRHAVPELVNDTVRRRGAMKMATDFAVPFERNKEMMGRYRDVLESEFPRQHAIFGHIGDAHVHANILPHPGAEEDRAREVMLDLARYAVALGGTVSAEHGLGKRKTHLLELQYTTAEIDAMKAVKRRLDPKWLLGQGTLFPNA